MDKEGKSFHNYPILVRESDASELKRLDPEKLVMEKPRKNKYCLPTEKEIKRRKELFAEFNRMHDLAHDTCDWLISHGFPVTNNDRRNLAALMKTCFDPLPFSSIGKKPKEVVLVLQERDAAPPKPVKLKEKERFKHFICHDHIGSTLREYIKKQKESKPQITDILEPVDEVTDTD